MVSPSTFKRLIVIALMGLLCSCSTSNDVAQDIMHGTIAYPFVDRQNPLGHNGPSEKFIVRSTIGDTEYSMEIPGAARDYDIEVPLADLSTSKGKRRQRMFTGNQPGNPAQTDRELKKSMPKIAGPEDRPLVENAFGVGELDGPKQSPSYIYGVAKINEHYLNREYEFALVEINNLINYYPSAAKLHKMKGTILMKLRNFKLAEVAWSRASELNPNDLGVKTGLENLRDRMRFDQDRAQSLKNASIK